MVKDTGFLKRAESEILRYGKDPWVLIRELGQNSRDACASRIDVVTVEKDQRHTLVFSDDGRGMTFEHARKYLFRLYASSKGDDEFSAGRYGVGFWSILLFQPENIEIHSRTKKSSWAVGLSGDLQQWNNISCRQTKPGTTIMLSRLAQGNNEYHDRTIKTALIRYLSRLRTAGRTSRPLPVFFNSSCIMRPFKLNSPASLSFSDVDAEGVVGFGKLPAYQLYARGLPVTRGSFLEELEGQHVRGRDNRERQGAAPVYLINGDHLDVVLSRKTLIKNRALRRLIDTARRRFDQLVSITVGCTVKRSFMGKMMDALRSANNVPAWARWMFFLIFSISLSTGFSTLAWKVGKAEGESQSMASRQMQTQKSIHTDSIGLLHPKENIDQNSSKRSKSALQMFPAISPSVAREAVASTVTEMDSLPEWSLFYNPPEPLMFRLFTLDHFDAYKGWQPGVMDDNWAAPKIKVDRQYQVAVSMDFSGGPGSLLLPLPSGFSVVPDSGSIEGQQARLLINQDGLLKVLLDREYNSKLTYQVAPIARQNNWIARDHREIPLPFDLQNRVDVISRLPEQDKKVSEAVELVKSLVRYDRSQKTIKAYAAHTGQNYMHWMNKVIYIGAGDCDVMNGLLTTILLQLDIPARMVVGIIGENGRGVSGWHAWVECENNEFGILDATVGSRLLETKAQPDTTVAEQAVQNRPDEVTRNSPETILSVEMLKNNARTIYWILLGLASAGFLWLLMHRVRRTARKGQITIAKDVRKRRKLLASMAVDALRRPAAWREVPGLWHKSFIPCQGGRLISLSKLMQVAAKDQIFIGKQENHLTKDALRAGVWVLNRDDQDFAEFFSHVAHLRDLDELVRLNPRLPCGNAALKLIRDMDVFVRKMKLGISCRVIDPVEEGLFRDVDLSPIKPKSSTGWSSKFIGVNPEHPWWQNLALIYPRDPKLALCIAIDHFSEVSSLLKPKAAIIRRVAALRVLRSAV